MAIKLMAADFIARTGIIEGSAVRWKTDKPDTENTATVVLLHDTGIELAWKDIKQAQYSLEEAFRNFALVSPGAPVPSDSPVMKNFIMERATAQTPDDFAEQHKLVMVVTEQPHRATNPYRAKFRETKLASDNHRPWFKGSGATPQQAIRSYLEGIAGGILLRPNYSVCGVIIDRAGWSHIQVPAEWLYDQE